MFVYSRCFHAREAAKLYPMAVLCFKVKTPSLEAPFPLCSLVLLLSLHLPCCELDDSVNEERMGAS